jgi:DinB superfamily
MTSAELLVAAFGRIRGVVYRAVDGLTPEQLVFRLDPETNSIAWLVWHLTRIQDTTSETLADRGAVARSG